MNYQAFFPQKELQDYIRYFWVLEDCSFSGIDTKSFKIIPDGIPALIFQEDINLFYDCKGRALPQLYLYGQSSKATENRVIGAFRILGVYLQPTALKAIFNIDAFEFNNQNVSLDQVVSDPILEQLLHAHCTSDKIEIISTFFLAQIAQVKHNAQQAQQASFFLQQGKTLQQIQLDMNLSERSLERLIKQYVGLSPKLFSRLMRFQSGLDRLRQADYKNLTEIAYQQNYFDQSHYIREFKEFTGATPEKFIRQASEHLVNFPLWNK